MRWLVVAALLGVAACGSPAPAEPPSVDDEQAFISEVARLQPGHIADEQKVLDLGMNFCYHLDQGEPMQSLIDEGAEAAARGGVPREFVITVGVMAGTILCPRHQEAVDRWLESQ